MSEFRKGIFVSYSHGDREWLDKLRVMLAPALRDETLMLWDGSRIAPGDDWKAEIDRAIRQARVALLLVSPDFLASSFVNDYELPQIFDQLGDGLTLQWVAVRPSLVDRTPLADVQALNDPSKPLSTLPAPEQQMTLKAIADALARAADFNALANALRVIDDFGPEAGAFAAGEPEPDRGADHGVVAHQVHDEIHFERRDGTVAHTMTHRDLDGLDPRSQQLIRAYETSMEDLFDQWTELKPRRNARDAGVRDRARQESERLKNDLCGELTELLGFIAYALSGELDDHYNEFRYICDRV